MKFRGIKHKYNIHWRGLNLFGLKCDELELGIMSSSAEVVGLMTTIIDVRDPNDRCNEPLS